MHSTTPLITTLVGGLVLAFLFGMLANRLRISPLVGYLLAGVLAGPFTPGLCRGYQSGPGVSRTRGNSTDVWRRATFFSQRSHVGKIDSYPRCNCPNYRCDPSGYGACQLAGMVIDQWDRFLGSVYLPPVLSCY